MAVAFHRLKVADVRRETPDAVSVAFVVPAALAEAYRFRPGQHVTLRAQFDGIEIRRSYSICSAPGDGELRIAVKKMDDGLFSAWINEAMKPGDDIDVMTPQGRFGLSADPNAVRIYLAIAAGSGITPILSLARTLLRGEPQSEFVLIYGNRTSQSIIFKDALEDLKDQFLERFTMYHVLSREQQDLALLNGRIDAEKIAALVGATAAPDSIDHVFLCGPGGLIEESKAALVRLGVPAHRIHIEYFSDDGALTQVVEMLEGETIVDAGLRHGLDMPYSCRGGMCCTCRARLLQGEVAMDQNYSLEPWELQAGYVLTCQSHPKTPRVVVDYDRL